MEGGDSQLKVRYNVLCSKLYFTALWIRFRAQDAAMKDLVVWNPAMNVVVIYMNLLTRISYILSAVSIEWFHFKVLAVLIAISNQSLGRSISANFEWSVFICFGFFSNTEPQRSCLAPYWNQWDWNIVYQLKSDKAFRLYEIPSELLAAPFSLIWLKDFIVVWLKAFIFPVYKKGSKVDPNNYQPISLLSVTGKICASFFMSLIESLD